MSLVRGAIGATLVLGLAHAAARWQAAKLRALPDRYPLDVLSKEPQGEEVFVERPDGTRLRAVHRGEGPAVVMAHGYGISLLEWNLLWDLLAAEGDVRLVAFDQRGHGRSTIGSDGVGSAQMAGDYRAVLEHFDVRDGVLVGHSMGSFLAVVFLLDHAECAKERLRGAVLVSAMAGDVANGSPQTRLQLPLIRAGLMTRIMQSETYGAFFGASLMGDEKSPAVIEAFNRVFCAQDHMQLIPIAKAIVDENYYPRLGEIQSPVVVVCGEKDRTTPAWHSRRLGAEIPGARNVWVPGKGHVLNWEAPEALAEAIRSLRA